MSAWIEIRPTCIYGVRLSVALLVSAWIEIIQLSTPVPDLLVALLVSAWIEIENHDKNYQQRGSRTPRECVD